MTSAGQEVGVLFVGNLTNSFVFSTLIGLAYFLQRKMQHVPRLVYKFVASYGVATVFDATLLFTIDLATWVRFRFDNERG